MSTNKIINSESGKLEYEDYYRFGQHIFEFPAGVGKKRYVAACSETPHGDSGLFEEHGDWSDAYEYARNNEHDAAVEQLLNISARNE